jgi:4-hydroxy-3-polyprenylbenzoate decarboxylase
VDITNLNDVMWATCTRIDPQRDVEILKRMPGSLLDPAAERQTRTPHNSRLLIDATRPYEWREKFAPTVEVSEELLERVEKKWASQLKDR